MYSILYKLKFKKVKFNVNKKFNINFYILTINNFNLSSSNFTDNSFKKLKIFKLFFKFINKVNKNIKICQKNKK